MSDVYASGHEGSGAEGDPSLGPQEIVWSDMCSLHEQLLHMELEGVSTSRNLPGVNIVAVHRRAVEFDFTKDDQKQWGTLSIAANGDNSQGNLVFDNGECYMSSIPDAHQRYRYALEVAKAGQFGIGTQELFSYNRYGGCWSPRPSLALQELVDGEGNLTPFGVKVRGFLDDTQEAVGITMSRPPHASRLGRVVRLLRQA